ncbi:MAG: adenylosuccinate synthase [Thermotogae bacterium]|nr:adenylosuccinate synthase [Thermotogota bacterium]
MPYTAIVGLQWGDEGKGKVIDYLAGDYDVIVRFQGGANAGHSVHAGGKSFTFHLLPSGMLHEGVVGVIAPGLAVDPEELLGELRRLEEVVGSLSGRLFLDPRTHVVLPYHKKEDSLFEESSDNPIGTTRRGIGPANRDRYARIGIRVGDTLRPSRLKEHLRRSYDFNRKLVEIYGDRIPPFEEIYDFLLEFGRKVEPYVEDTVILLTKEERRGARILLEGAQGTFLDTNFGTYPYVTSSHPISGGATIGAGIPPWKIDRVVGVFKTYTTRVGEGPFPTEEKGELGERLRRIGGEYGATTGRPRRCGWLDIPMIRYAILLNGVTELFITKVDVLQEVGIYRMALEYEINGERIPYPPPFSSDWYHLRPIYRDFSTLEEFLDAVERETGVDLNFVSVGKERSAVIERQKRR